MGETSVSELAEAIFSASPDGVLLVDPQGTIVMANPQAAELFAMSSEALTGASVEDLIPHEFREAHVGHRERFAEAPRVRAMGAGLDLVGQRSDGSHFPVDIALSHITVDDTPLMVASVRDISERRFAEAELRIAHERISLLEDRERIARDLHDTVIQEVFGAGLTIQGALGRIEDDDVRERLTATIGRLDASMATLRRVIFDLKEQPASGVRQAVDDVLAAAAGELQFSPALRLMGDLESIDPGTISHLIPVLREALTNVAKHASAGSVDVSIAVGDYVTLTVTDDGVGLERAAGEGFGLSNLEERATELNGQFVIVGREATGTRVVWRVPRTGS